MSKQLLDDLSAASQLLLQLAARHEYAPLHYAQVPPLGEADVMRAVSEVQERGLLAPASDAPGILLLTPVGYALRDAIRARWSELHAELRPRLLAHVSEMFGIAPGSELHVALEAVDRSWFVPDATLPLADLDVPVPIGVDEMTTSAPHAIVALLRATMPQTGERVLVCGAKGGVTIALSAWMVGEAGAVLGLDWAPDTVAHASASVGRVPGLDGRARVEHADDVTLGRASEGPFHVVIVNGSIPKIPWDLVDQLDRDTGRLLLFLQEASGDGQTCYLLRADGSIHEDAFLSRFVFTPIHGRWGWDRVGDFSRGRRVPTST